tara:strand:- start:839 stop:1111 length:273 start_codon:yes stop_codon:yes gene_type:complete
MLFHLPKLPAELRVSHLNARVNEQRKKIAQTTASKLEFLQLTQQLVKEAKIRKKNNQKIFVLDFKGSAPSAFCLTKFFQRMRIEKTVEIT